MGAFFFFYMLFEVYLKRMIEILNAAKFSASFYIFSIFGFIGLGVFPFFGAFASLGSL